LVVESIIAISTLSLAPFISEFKLTAYAFLSSGKGIPICPVALLPNDHSKVLSLNEAASSAHVTIFS